VVTPAELERGKMDDPEIFRFDCWYKVLCNKTHVFEGSIFKILSHSRDAVGSESGYFHELLL
jgi:hypothetical protein